MRGATCVLLMLTAAVGATISVASASAVDKTAGSTLEGRWRTTRATVQEMVAIGIPRKDAEKFRSTKHPGLEFRKGTFRGLDVDTGQTHGTGTYRLDGNVIRLVFRTGIAVQLGRTYWLRWSVYRDRLTFSSAPGRRNELQLFCIKPWTRVR